MLKIRQSYIDKNSDTYYTFKVYHISKNIDGLTEVYLGELDAFPEQYKESDIFSIDGIYYTIAQAIDSPFSFEEKEEVVYYILEEYGVSPDFDLSII